MDTQNKQKPTWHLKDGVIEIACWTNPVQSDDGKTRDFFTITLARSYKDKKGDWQTAASLRRADLLPAARLLEAAYDKLKLTKPELES